jgi:hypothetical protein
MRGSSSRNRFAFGTSLAAGLLVAVAVGAVAATRDTNTSTGMVPADQGVSPTKAMSVFDRPSPAGEALSASSRKALVSLTQDEPGVASSLLPGNADLAKGRNLISSPHWTLAAAPTGKGNVCSVVLDSDGTYTAGGCVDAFTGKLPIVPNITTLGSNTTVVYGLASDSVEAVAIVVNGVEHQATLSNDAFLFQPSSGASVSSVLATLADGSRVTVPLTASTLGG